MYRISDGISDGTEALETVDTVILVRWSIMHILTQTRVKNAKPKNKPWKLADGGSLYLLVNLNGSKYWRYDYRIGGRRKTLPLGVYPEISLKRVRELHLAARELVRDGQDPMLEKKGQKAKTEADMDHSFKRIASEWFEVKMADKSDGYQIRIRRVLENDLFPVLGTQPITNISAPELLAVLRKIEERGARDIARRTRQLMGVIYRYAIQTGRADRDVSADLHGALQPPVKKHRAAITEPLEVKRLMGAISGYEGSIVVRAALRLSALLFQRPGEIRHMEWTDIDFHTATWSIPAEKMKMKHAHIVPLSTQVLSILTELHEYTGQGKYVLPSPRGSNRCMSENGVRTALRTMGFDNDTMTPHGFRAMARTILDEVMGYRVEWIEQQLAHQVRDSNGRAYNRTKHLDGRRQMMQAWSDYLYELGLGSRESAQPTSRQSISC